MVVMTEQWLSVLNYEGLYWISDFGRVMNCHGLILKQRIDKWNRATLDLHNNGKRRTCKVGTLVLETFVSERPPGLEALHDNDIQSDNRLINLRWGTHSENVHDAVKNGKHPMARKTQCDKGHEFTPENTRIRYRSDGSVRQRVCRVCAYERNDPDKDWNTRRSYATSATSV